MTQYQQTPGLMYSSLPNDEIVIMDPDLVNYYSIESPATTIWEQFEQPTSVEDVVGTLVERFDVAPEVCLAETSKFVESLLQRKLLVAV